LAHLPFCCSKAILLFCVFSEGAKFRYFSNYELSPKTFNSYQEVVDDFADKRYRLICWDEVDPVTLKQLAFHKV
jgi:hypothetical protein